ncbi:inactive polypeptide N-acetylgalactosaminyltransferase-like protein 5 [Pteropus medius]|uniref:inactive polypeptide N-acetylgalactosaminyltransferase-like protein 5 n=1 Tax=Pteropus vampyrus TaxID=132908 RepID=UPI00196A46CB|nr:inactive polypeptide N-acetylgalactosaminyltransferase-like protein 5 [Pteropus giganteus]
MTGEIGWTLKNARFTMRHVIIQCLLCGSLTFGIWTALSFIYLCHNYVSDWPKETQEATSVWSLDKKLQQIILHGSGTRPKPRVRVKRPNRDETKERGTFLKLAKKFNYTDPNLVHGFFEYGFNAVVSTSLGRERLVPDTRDKMCRRKHYPVSLPTASIVICFHNEEFNALFRTVSSVINLTPHHVLEEIILVDDMSEFDDLKEKLDHHLEMFRGKIKLIRNQKREGLIRARLIGASRASGDVLVFLDSHCEVNRVWLEPLLYAISKDRKMVVCPVIDVIDSTTLEYRPSPLVRGAFDWYLQFKWDNVFSYELDGPEGLTRPIRSPAMAGGIFAIRRHYFNEIGQYDKGMDLWGGENLELSLRIWMCGGQIFILPCSRVGHITKQLFSHSSGVIRAMTYNSLRLAHVWLDEYKEQVFLRRPGLRFIPYGNISERVELRKRLGCKSFQWYLDTIFPELEPSKSS